MVAGALPAGLPLLVSAAAGLSAGVESSAAVAGAFSASPASAGAVAGSLLLIGALGAAGVAGAGGASWLPPQAAISRQPASARPRAEGKRCRLIMAGRRPHARNAGLRYSWPVKGFPRRSDCARHPP